MAADALRQLQYQFLWRVLGRRTLLAPAPEFGLHMRISPGDAVGRHIYKHGEHDAARTRFVLHRIPWTDGDAFLDIGAHIGWYSLALARNVPAGIRVVAFEPDTQNRELLRQNVELNGARAVTIVDRAVSDHAGTERFYRYARKNQGRHSLLPINEGDVVEVECVTLDATLPRLGIAPARVALAKLDIEGGELQALRGGRSLLGAAPRLLLEYSPRLMRQAGQDPAELLDLLHGAGYTAWDIDSDRPRIIARNELEAVADQRDCLWCLAGAAPAS